jgi:hypothetical protein
MYILQQVRDINLFNDIMPTIIILLCRIRRDNLSVNYLQGMEKRRL